MTDSQLRWLALALLFAYAALGVAAIVLAWSSTWVDLAVLLASLPLLILWSAWYSSEPSRGWKRASIALLAFDTAGLWLLNWLIALGCC